jgi:2-hydroxychromene-2-carboxylate isomerase
VIRRSKKAICMADEMKKIEFWFEFGSTYSYPAAMRIEAAAAARRIGVSWRSFLLGPIFQAQGWNDSPFNIYPVKGAYMWRDMERICAKQGIVLKRPTRFPRNGLLAARVACRFAAEPWLPAFVRAVYRANFEHDRDIADPGVVGECLSVAGARANDSLAEAQTAEAKAALRTQTDEAIRLSIFGAPSFTAGAELFWGNDRLEDALDWCIRQG